MPRISAKNRNRAIDRHMFQRLRRACGAHFAIKLRRKPTLATNATHDPTDGIRPTNQPKPSILRARGVNIPSYRRSYNNRTRSFLNIDLITGSTERPEIHDYPSLSVLRRALFTVTGRLRLNLPKPPTITFWFDASPEPFATSQFELLFRRLPRN